MSILVTILTWNRSSLLKKTIKTFRNKNCNGFDILVLDNGSIDDTRGLLKTMGIEVISNVSNDGIFEGTKRLWLEAFNRGYDFVINLQNDFPCIRSLPFNDMSKYMNNNDDVGFILLNDKSKMIKIHSSGRKSIKRSKRVINKLTGKKLRYDKWNRCGDTDFIKFNHHFTFNPTFVRTSILPGIMLDNSKPRERGIMEGYNKIGLLSAKTRKCYFETILRKRLDNWIH